MFGIVIAVLVAAWAVFIGNSNMEAGFLSAVGFLWVWYWIWTVVIGLIFLVVMLGATGALTLAGADSARSRLGGLFGGMLGFAAGGALSILVIGVVMISRALLLGGVYLLMTSGSPQMSFTEFSTNKLIFGTLLLVLGLVMSKSSSSSSSDKS